MVNEQLKAEIKKIQFMAHAIKFDGKKAKVWYSKGEYTKESGLPKGTITIYAGGYGDQLPRALNPQNETDMMTDYFDKDKARIKPDSPFYKKVLKAVKKREEFDEKWAIKRRARADAYRRAYLERQLKRMAGI